MTYACLAAKNVPYASNKVGAEGDEHYELEQTKEESPENGDQMKLHIKHPVQNFWSVFTRIVTVHIYPCKQIATMYLPMRTCSTDIAYTVYGYTHQRGKKACENTLAIYITDTPVSMSAI